MYRHYKRGFAEALAGDQIDPPDDPTKQIRGGCDERAHYTRGYRDGCKARADFQTRYSPVPEPAYWAER